MGRPAPTVAVLALQGAVDPHLAAFADLGVRAAQVRQVAHLEALGPVQGIVLPGGESTTLSLLLRATGLDHALGTLIDAGTPVLGTCAGMIVLAREVIDGRPDQLSFSAIDIAVRRNGFGRQIQSFETPLDISALDDERPFPGVFIRAPFVERVGPGVDVLAALPDGPPVLCRQGPVMVASFHPELTADRRIHAAFVRSISS